MEDAPIATSNKSARKTCHGTKQQQQNNRASQPAQQIIRTAESFGTAAVAALVQWFAVVVSARPFHFLPPSPLSQVCLAHPFFVCLSANSIYTIPGEVHLLLHVLTHIVALLAATITKLWG